MAGAGLAAVKWPGHAQQIAKERFGITVPHQQVKGSGIILAGAGAATIGHGAYHYGRAAGYEKRLRKINHGVGARAVGVREVADSAVASNSFEYRNAKRKRAKR